MIEKPPENQTEKPGGPGRRIPQVTMTGEPFQPVRLYYAIPDRSFVMRRLKGLACVVEAPAERCLHWLFEAEAAALPIGAGYDAVPEERRPIVLGRIRFPANGGMTIQTNSANRAIAAAPVSYTHLTLPTILRV